MENKIKVLHFVRVLDRGGIESFIFSNYAYMDREQYIFDFLLLRSQTEAYEAEVSAYGSQKICINIEPDTPMMVRHPASFYRIYQVFKTMDYDTVHFHSVSPALSSVVIVALAALAGIKQRIIHAHLAMDTDEFPLLRRIKYRAARQMFAWLGTDFLACSSLAADYYYPRRAIHSKNFAVINNAVDVQRFRYDQQVRNECRREMNLEHQYVIGNIGRFVVQKNHVFMLEVFKQVLKLQNNAVLLLIGGEVESEKGRVEEIRQMSELMGIADAVIFTGETTETAKLLQAMDVFFFPSLFEGLGIACVEAQAAGLPVVCASNYIPREVQISEQFSWLDLQAPPKVWAEALLKPHQHNRQNAYLNVSQAGYSAEITARQLEKIYQKTGKGH